MNEGPDPAGQHRRRAPDSQHSDGVAEVFNRFTLDSGARGWRWRRAQPAPGPERTTEPPATEGAAKPPAASTSKPPESAWPAADGLFESTESKPAGSRPNSDASSLDDEMSTSIRPYAWTGGRTRSNKNLELQTLVSISELCSSERLRRAEHHSIAELCQRPRSVAEVGALLGVPLGVARVLLGDMADVGLISVHETVSDNTSSSHFLLMERVLSGLRRL